MKFIKNTRVIVIIGYCVLMILVISGVAAIYLEMVKASNISKEPDSKLKLISLNNTLNNLYEAEGVAVIMVSINDSRLYAEYDSLMGSVFEQIDSMKLIEENPQTLLDLDSLTILLNKRVNNFQVMVNLLNQLENSAVKEITNTAITSFGDTSKISNVLANKIHSIQDTAKTVSEKKGFIRRVGDVFKSGSPDTLTQIKSSTALDRIELALPLISDTLVTYMKETGIVVEKKNAKIIRALVERQKEFHLINEQTSLKIEQIMNQIKDSVYQHNLNILNEHNKALVKSLKLVVTIGLLALAVTIFFLSYTLSSINESFKLQRKIQEAKDSVDNLLISREQLISTITHDIKAPISSILGFLDLLLNENISQKQQYYVKNMHTSANYILNLVKNMLDFQSLKKNNLETIMVSFSPSSLINEIYDSFLPFSQKLTFKLNSTIPDGKLFICDPYRIKQIVNNLISNAIKFTPENGSVILSASIEKGNIFRVSVKDSGPGISEEDKNFIFEEFTRLNETKKTTEGTGLGLPISKKLSSLMNGNVEVNSKKGQGADFILTIPLIPDENKVLVEYKAPTTPSANPDKNICILFVDDDIVQLNLLSELVKRAGLSCVCSESSSKALKLLEKESFDIIFTDIQMPDIKGFELAGKIRKSSFQKAQTVPIIGLSADSNWMEKHPENGFTDFLAKPFNMEDVLRIIEKYTTHTINFDKAFPKTLDLSNPENLLEYVSNDREAALNLIDLFLEEARNNLKLFENAWDNKDFETVKQISHKMISLSNMLQAPEFISLLNLFEKGEQSEEKRVIFSNLCAKKLKEVEEIRNKIINS